VDVLNNADTAERGSDDGEIADAGAADDAADDDAADDDVRAAACKPSGMTTC
jgi:hypothetical protein